MTREIIAAALEAEGLKGGQSIAVPEGRDATFFVGAPGEVLNVPKVVKLELRDQYLYLQSGKDERFFFAYEDVLGFRMIGAATARERPAGFAR